MSDADSPRPMELRVHEAMRRDGGLEPGHYLAAEMRTLTGPVVLVVMDIDGTEKHRVAVSGLTYGNITLGMSIVVRGDEG